jgi:hypothetical protein
VPEGAAEMPPLFISEFTEAFRFTRAPADRGLKERPMAKRTMTNIEKVTHIMTYSNYGALAQLFVMDALHQWSGGVSKASPEQVDNGFINGEAWIGVAGEIHKALQSELTINSATQGSRIPLPPDIDGMNDDRAQWAKAALKAFIDQTGVDYEDALADLLADLMHLADREPFDFESDLDRAREHYAAETGAAP